jgi:hypothetical protein
MAKEKKTKSEKKTLCVSIHGKEWKLHTKINEYQNGGVYVGLSDCDEGYEESFADLTVWLTPMMPELNGKAMAFIDTNNCPWAVKMIEDAKLGKPTGVNRASGYCQYPMYELDMNAVREYLS